jgi:formamidopyrimidine-DNA glycosylase
MPELPEVETVRLQLLHKIVLKTIQKVTVYHTKTTAHNPFFVSTVTGKTIAHIDRIGKLLIMSFTGESDLFLLVHLKMTGQFFYIDNQKQVSGGGHTISATNNLDFPNRHTRVSFEFSDTSTLYFNDMRLFGYIKVANAMQMNAAKQKFGPEPIHELFSVDDFYEGLQRRKTTIKAVLLDQSFVAGLGNIYVDESLYAANISPLRLSCSLTMSEAGRLAQIAGNIMKTAISVGGTTFQHFVDTGGDNGNYTDYLKVFGKQNTPCSQCGTIISKIRVAGRGTHYCSNCQK